MSDLTWAVDFLMSPGGGLIALTIYQWWRIRRLSDTLAEYYARVIEAESRAARAEGRLGE